MRDVRPSRRDDASDLVPGDDLVVPVGGGRGSGTLRALVALGAVAILVSVVAPWRLLPAMADATPMTAPIAAASPAATATAAAVPSPAAVAARSSACASPQSWRIATIQSWFGRMARVWQAAEAWAGPPDGRSWSYEVIVAEEVRAIGWCAPVAGPDLPPLTTTARLWQLVNGSLELVPHRRIEPEEANSLGELWAPAADSGRTTWPPGRYVIELRTPTGTWRQVLGVELREPRRAPPAGPASATPDASPATP